MELFFKVGSLIVIYFHSFHIGWVLIFRRLHDKKPLLQDRSLPLSGAIPAVIKKSTLDFYGGEVRKEAEHIELVIDFFTM